ncbi:helix-turn-helix domain-containing protein [uncultured Jannaschia sp.]|uniref:helix-turn-helix domain-containing protein n=1 Tax=uncultured Jannaschia sp. TaxID=293347 RepID=UPI00260E9122|nr:helix-turn-helix domain-containing protein [uncultured Jannaschia sp.]
MTMPQKIPDKTPSGRWLQTERAAHEAWAKLIAEAPKAAQLMHLLVARIGENNAVVISQKNLIRLMGASRPTVQRAVKKLRDDLWIEVRQIGDRGTTNAYVINDRVAWLGRRDGIRYSLFSAAVVISDDEQPDVAELDRQEPLRQIPSIGRGERQLPTGPGLPPPSEPTFPGMEADLPAKTLRDDVEP